MRPYKITKKSALIFQKGIYAWSIQNPRPMPWKEETDPYKIWVSEIILQQTRVSQGWEYYKKFIQLFPDIASLASASLQSVLKAWEGLGYYTRAKNIHASASMINSKFGGIFPKRYEDIITLKGIGQYTASAIASFAYGAPYAVLDGNVHRIFARYLGVAKSMNTSAEKKEFQQIANEFLDTTKPGKYNQAIMDFGAKCCTPINPKCEICPLNKHCNVYAYDIVHSIPPPKKKIKKKERYFHYFIYTDSNKIYVQQRLAADIWQGLYEFYLIEGKNASLAPAPGSLPIKNLSKIKPILKDKQILSHQIVHTYFYNSPAIKIQGLIPIKKANCLAYPRVIARNMDTILKIVQKEKK